MQPFDSHSPAAYSALFDELWPLCRSITGQGLRDSLAIFDRHMGLKIDHVASGTEVFDWSVPPEWTIRSATLTGPDGEVIADFAVSNLHVVNYSEPVDLHLELEELQEHLYSIPHLPDLLPYVTSYYERRWGFCISETARKALKPGTYHARIDSDLAPGAVSFGSTALEGERPDEILLTSYLCHPSLANNELSGPLVLLGLFDRIRAWPRRRYSYRFLLNPETIGSLCFLYRNEVHVTRHTVSGLVLTCLGGPNDQLSYKPSRRGDALCDRLAQNLCRHAPDAWSLRQFTPVGGSDERQFCAPGFDLPMGQIARTIYGQYPEYHTSGDDKTFMDIDRIKDSVDRIEGFLLAQEHAGVWVSNVPKGEPQLGKRGLYPTINRPKDWFSESAEIKAAQRRLELMLWILNDADGKRKLIGTADRAGCPLTDLIEPLEALIAHDLIEEGPFLSRL